MLPARAFFSSGLLRLGRIGAQNLKRELDTRALDDSLPAIGETVSRAHPRVRLPTTYTRSYGMLKMRQAPEPRTPGRFHVRQHHGR